MWNFKDDWWNLEYFKAGGKLKIYELAGLGVFTSIWTSWLVAHIFENSGKYENDAMMMFIENTFLIIYLSSAIGLIWGLHISDLRYVQVWNAHKYVEIAINIIFLIIYPPPVLVLIYIMNLVLGVYVIMSVWNHCQNLQDLNNKNSSIDENKYMLTKHSSIDFPTVHK